MEDKLVMAICLLVAGALTICSVVYWTIRLGIAPTPTSARVGKTVSTVLPETVKGEVFELGCGWGSLIGLLSSHFPEHTIKACEQSPIPWLVSWLRFFRNTRITVAKADIFSQDISQAGLVVCYINRRMMARLATHLESELPEGCFILSHTFRLPGWQPVLELKAEDLYKTPVYLYQKPLSATQLAKRNGVL